MVCQPVTCVFYGADSTHLPYNVSRTSCRPSHLAVQPQHRSHSLPPPYRLQLMLSQTRPGDRFVYAHSLKRSIKCQPQDASADYCDRPCDITISTMGEAKMVLETEPGRWASLRGYDLNHRSGDKPNLVDGADITASGLYWRITERLFEPARATTKWITYATSTGADGSRAPRWPHTHASLQPQLVGAYAAAKFAYPTYNTSY